MKTENMERIHISLSHFQSPQRTSLQLPWHLQKALSPPSTCRRMVVRDCPASQVPLCVLPVMSLIHLQQKSTHYTFY